MSARVVWLAVFTMIAVVAGACFWTALLTKDAALPTREGAARFVEALRNDYRLPIPKNLDVVEYENRSGRDMEIWALIRVRPEMVADVRRALLDYAAKQTNGTTLDDDDGRTADQVRGTRAQDLPAWWQPGTLPDGDVIVIRRMGGVFVVVLSAKMGLMYVVRWDV